MPALTQKRQGGVDVGSRQLAGQVSACACLQFPCCVPEFSDCQCDPVIQGYQALSEDPQV